MLDARTLPEHVEHLYRAVGDLVDEPKQLICGQLRVAPSLWMQLVSANSYTNRDSRSAGQFGSRPTVNVGALDLRCVIDKAVACWTAELFTAVNSSTDSRIRALAAYKWSPNQIDLVDKYARSVDAWVARAEQVLGLSDAHVKTLSAPCPSCQATHVYRKDSSGDTVRQPALQLVAETGCTCMGCGAFWSPSSYMLLARILFDETPTGVLE